MKLDILFSVKLHLARGKKYIELICSHSVGKFGDGFQEGYILRHMELVTS